jgi:FMN phosphatase YigB (HAD superfamily)
MPLTLEQYATTYLDSRGLPWPVAPKVESPKAKPHLARLPVRAVMWNVYGTLLAVPGGELWFEHPTDFVMDAALDKTIQEFKMWQSMSRKPGAPAAYMRELYNKALTTLKLAGSGGEKYPEVPSERVWEDIVKKLLQKEYHIDVGVYGALNEFVKKVAYFFHASIQGSGAYPGTAEALRMVADAGKLQGLLADGQCFTPAQLLKALQQQDPGCDLGYYFPVDLRILSAEKRARKPSETLFRAATEALAARGVKPAEVLHVGSNLARDIAPAKKLGIRTALFAGDKASLAATAEQLKDANYRPDVLLTELPQIADVIG